MVKIKEIEEEKGAFGNRFYVCNFYFILKVK